MVAGALHIANMSTDGPTHNTKAKEANNGDTGEQAEEKEGDGLEEKEGGERQMKSFQKQTFYNSLTLHKTLKPKTHPSSQLKTSPMTHKFGLMCKPFPSLWIFDYGATDTMTFDPHDLLSTNPKTRTYIQTANGECVNVDQSGPVTISPSLKLNNCLLIPSLPYKLLSISQLTRELNCTMLRQGGLLGVVLNEMDCTMWTRQFKRDTLCLLMGSPIINYGLGIDV